MQPTSEPPPSAISLVPPEICSHILRQLMSSAMPVDLENFLTIGQRYRRVRKWLEGQGADNCEISAWSKQYFLDRLDPTQMEHYEDWVVINSTCRAFRTCGRKAFFSTKTFVISPEFLHVLRIPAAQSISAGKSLKVTALANIRQVVVPIEYCWPPILKLIPDFHAFARFRSLTIEPHHGGYHCGSKALVASAKRGPLPESVSSVLRSNGLRLDDLQVDAQRDPEDTWDLFGRMAENADDSMYMSPSWVSLQDETEASSKDEAEANPEDETEASPQVETKASPEDKTEAGPEDETEASPEGEGGFGGMYSDFYDKLQLTRCL
ncbi:hypothetical protein MMC07_002483 [Pseudocyphellaria aurata]|nr:hypothetical protein [Pseudocyphellaria aurata]